MLTLKTLSLGLFGTAIIFMGANPAAAAAANPVNPTANLIRLTQGGSTPITGEGQYTNIKGATTINFNDGKAPSSGLVTYSATNGIVEGNVSGQYASPFGNTSKFLTISPKGDKDNGQDFAGNSGDVTINFASAVDYFGFYWGSIDTYNFVDVYSKGTLLKTFNGGNVPGAPANGEQSGSANNVYVNLLADQGQTFDKVVMRSTGRAFETDNHSYRVATSVPEPSTMLSLVAFGALGAGSLTKRKLKRA